MEFFKSLFEKKKALKEPDEAKKWLDKGLKILGNTSKSKACIDDANEAFDHALKIKPDYGEVWFIKGGLLYGRGQYKEAIDAFNHAIDSNWNEKQGLLYKMKGDALLKLDRFEEALKMLDAAEKNDSDSNDEVCYLRGLALGKLNRHKEALDSFDQALKINPIHKGALEGYLVSLSKLDNLDLVGKTRSSFSKTIMNEKVVNNSASKNADGWCKEGKSAFQLGKTKEAINAFENAIIVDPNCAKAWYYKGSAIHHSGGNLDDAIKAYDNAVKIDPNCAQAWHDKGCALDSLSKYEEAITSIKHALTINPKYANAWYSLGVGYSELEKYEEAIEAYKNSLNINPNNAMAWNNKGRILFQCGKYSEANDAFDHAILVDPKYIFAWNNKGTVLSKLGKYQEAIKVYEEGLKIAPNHAELKKNRNLALEILNKDNKSQRDKSSVNIPHTFVLVKHLPKPPDEKKFIQSMIASGYISTSSNISSIYIPRAGRNLTDFNQQLAIASTFGLENGIKPIFEKIDPFIINDNVYGQILILKIYPEES